MADISSYIKIIEQASRGEEVRDAIINALKAINTGASYTLSISGTTITLTDGNGTPQSADVPSDTNTTYTLSLSGNALTLTPSEGEVQSVTLPTVTDTNTTYTLSISGNVLTLTPSSGEAQSVTLPFASSEAAESVLLKSSTEGSTKQFKVTVDDTGALTATEVTAAS